MDDESTPAVKMHPKWRSWRLRAFALFGAVLIATAWGSVVQTQFNIASLASIGAEIPIRLRLQITALDLLGFTPIYAVIVSIGLLCTLPVAAPIARWQPLHRSTMYALAGTVGIASAIRIVDIATPVPTLIAATRGTTGWLLMVLGGTLAGWWFAHHTRQR